MKMVLPFEETKRKILVKKEGTTDPAHGCNPYERSIKDLIRFGIVNINKPPGPTSHQVADYVKKILRVKKCGHGGTLDPLVTGVLPIALADGTRVIQALLGAGKTYVALMRLHKQVPEKQVRDVFKKFTGRITQLPPVRSAVKRQERQRDIYALELLEMKGQDVLFRVACQGGTYIRKLIHDMGRSLNVGAHMAELVRVQAGPFKHTSWQSLQDLQDAYVFWKEDGTEDGLRKIIRPFEEAVAHLPKVWLFDNAVPTVCHGAYVGAPAVVRIESDINSGDKVALMTLKDELIGLGKALKSSDEIIEAEKDIVVETEKIFMERDIYPRK